MFILIMGRAQGVVFGIKEFFWYNMFPASLGNWVGGAAFMAIVYAYVYGKPSVFVRTKRL
jgi:formate/nitrite transporter FocA (FNT family)